MGNYRFRLSDMMPNAWFYKLRDMSKLKNQNPSHTVKKNLPSSTTFITNPRRSFYYTSDSLRMDKNLCNSPSNPKLFDTPFPFDPPRKSKSKRKTVYMPSPRKITPDPDNLVGREFRIQNCLDGPTSSDDQDFLESLSEFDQYNDDDDNDDDGDSFDGRDRSKLMSSSSASDIIINVDETSSYAPSYNGYTELDVIPDPDLPPIATKPSKVKNSSPSVNFPARKTPGGRRSVSRSGGVKIRRKKGEKSGRKSVKKSEKKGKFYSESFAMVKASVDPERDFMESMVEMIVENRMSSSKDLEDLLACYLSLNSNQYHPHIIKAFEQIWFNMPHFQVFIN